MEQGRDLSTQVFHGHRELQAFKLLELIDDDGQPTDQFIALRKAPTDQFKDRLTEVLRSVYADVFQFLDPSTASMTDFSDAFRGFSPPGQRDRMVTLFLGLCEYVGLVKEPPKKLRPTRSTGGSASPRRRERASTVASASPRPAQATTETASDDLSEPVPFQSRPSPAAASELPPALRGFVAALPIEGEALSAERRAQFIRAFEALLDISYPVEGETGRGSDEAT